jgi:hypothetical protein
MRLQIQILPSTSKKMKKNLDSYGFVTFVQIRILLYSSMTVKTPTKKLIKKKFFCLFHFEGTFTSFFEEKKPKEVKRQKKFQNLS